MDSWGLKVGFPESPQKKKKKKKKKKRVKVLGPGRGISDLTRGAVLSRPAVLRFTVQGLVFRFRVLTAEDVYGDLGG